MKKRLMLTIWITLMFLMPMIQGLVLSNDIHTEITLNVRESLPAQTTGYTGTIPMNLSVIVGDSGDDLTNAYNYLASVPFAVRSNSTHTASGLLLPDDTEDYATPLDEWVDLLGGSMNELVFVGDVQNPIHTALTTIAENHITVDGTDHIEMAANLAQEFFIGATSVVLVETPSADQFSNTVTITDTTSTLSAMSTRSVSGTSSSSSDWEYFGSFTPSGGGAIITLTNNDPLLWFDLLAREDSIYYPMDFPYYDGQTVMHPFDDRPGSTWILHVIDFEDYSRTVSLHFDVQEPDADFYPFTIEPGEDCRIDFDLSVVGGTPRDIGLNVLDPSGNIILNANRYALMEDVVEVSEISVSLSHPAPGQYRAYVYSAEETSVTYDLDIMKRVISDERQAAAAGAANGAGLASLLGAPLLYTTDGSLDASTLQAIESLSPQIIYFMNPTGPVDENIETELNSLDIRIHKLETFGEVESILTTLDSRSDSQSSVILYDSLETTFAAAGLSVAHRRAPALPFSYQDSELMTLSQIPEQIGWNREYQMPLIATFSLLNVWTDDADFSGMNPPVESMTSIAEAFYSWLYETTGIIDVDKAITFAPYYGPGETLPPTFDRALTGKTVVGRYSSVDTSATLIQVMRSILRVPLVSAASKSHDVLGSYLVYSFGNQVMDNDQNYNLIDNSNAFPSLIAPTGLSTTMQVGPSTVSELATAPYAWIATVHGGTGLDLYKDDGRVALFSSNTWRAFDEYQSSSFPDADTDESPQYVVNPSESNMDIYNMSELVSGSNLRGMFALLDSCQLGSSYGPSTILESGADAVVACRTDCLVGPADMFEYNVISSMVDSHGTLGDALDYAFTINSHRYAIPDIGLDTYLSSSDAAIIGSSCLQFIVFGDPDITFYDWTATPHPVMDRCVGVGPGATVYVHPSSTYNLPLGMYDPVGNVYAAEGEYSINVFDANDNLLDSGVVICSDDELGIFEVTFGSTVSLGVYDVHIEDTQSGLIYTSQIVVEWPQLVVESVFAPSYSELGTWNLEIMVYNPHDVTAETTIQIRLNNEILLSSDASWFPGYSSNSFDLSVIFGPTGIQPLNIIMTIGTQSFVCSNFTIQVLVSGHWVTPVLWLVIPALSVCVVLSSVYTRRIGSKIILLRTGMEAETAGDHETAFDIYGKNKLSRAATRVAVKEDLPEKMMQALMHYYSNIVFNDLQAIANTAISNSDFRRASKIHLVLGHNEQGLQYKAIAELEEGQIDDAVQTFRELLLVQTTKYPVNVINHIQSMKDDIQSRFVTQAKDDILTLASRLRYEVLDQNVLLSIIESHVEDEYLVGLLVNFNKIDTAAEKILSLKTIPKMVELTKTLDENPRNLVVVPIVRSLTQSHKPKQVGKYITSIGISDDAVTTVVSPLIEQLIKDPSNKEILAVLHLISKSSSSGFIKVIDEAIDAVKSVIASAEDMGISVEHLKSSSLVPVIAGLKDRTMAEKLLIQTEKQALNDSVPASANIDALAKFVYGLRSSVYSYDDVLPQVPRKLANYEGTLQNRIGQAVQETFTTCQLRIETDDWLAVSSDEIAENIVTRIPLADLVSAIKGCFIAVSLLSVHHISEYLRNSFGVEKQAELANELMDNPMMRDRILRRHMKAVVDENGRTKWVPDLEASYRDAFDQVIAQWKPQAKSVFKIGIFKAALRIAQQAFDSQIPSKELIDISVTFLSGSHSFSSVERERILNFVRLLPKYFNREEMEAIIGRTRFPITILDEALS